MIEIKWLIKIWIPAFAGMTNLQKCTLVIKIQSGQNKGE